MKPSGRSKCGSNCGHLPAKGKSAHYAAAWLSPKAYAAAELLHTTGEKKFNDDFVAAFVLTPEAQAQHVAVAAQGGSFGQIAAFLLGIPLRRYAPIAIEQAGVMYFKMIKRNDVWYPTLVEPSPAMMSLPTA